MNPIKQHGVIQVTFRHPEAIKIDKSYKYISYDLWFQINQAAVEFPFDTAAACMASRLP